MKEDKDIIFQGYKEPLKKFTEGYGYCGVVSFSRSTGKIQCHICGEFFDRITSNHLMLHNLSVREYKRKVGIAYGTVLASDVYRKKLMENYVKTQRKIAPLQVMKANTRRTDRLVASNKARKGQKTNLETRNKRGNCPDQLIDKIRKLEIQMGEVPSKRDFMEAYGGRYMDILYKTFGSYPSAVRIAGMKPKIDDKREKYSNENLLQYIRNFLDKEGRPPRKVDCSMGRLPDIKVYIRRFGSFVTAKDIALFGTTPSAHITEYAV